MRATYQNSLFKAVEEANLNITAFSRNEENGSYTITYNLSDNVFYFQIVIVAPPKNQIDIFNTSFVSAITKLKTPQFTVKMSPGQIASIVEQDYFEWDELLSAFKEWLTWILEEVNTPDLWAEAFKTAQLFAPTAEQPDDKFTRTELAEVQGQLWLLQQSFTAAALPEAVRQKLIELTQTAAVKAEDFTKKDWQSWFIGAIIGHISEAVLNSEQIHEVYKLVKAAFGGLFLN